MGNWDGFDVGHDAFQQFDFLAQHVEPPRNPTLSSIAGPVFEAWDEAALVTSTRDAAQQ